MHQEDISCDEWKIFEDVLPLNALHPAAKVLVKHAANRLHGYPPGLVEFKTGNSGSLRDIDSIDT